MDLFTHMLFGFLFSSWGSGNFYNIYVILCCFVAILPDADVFFWPISERYPLLRHHGITHTLLFCISAPCVVFTCAGLLWSLWDIKLLLLLILSCCAHIFTDWLTTWGVPLFWPIKKKHYKLSIDLAVNPYIILSFFVSIVLLQLAKGVLPFGLGIWEVSLALGVFYATYFSGRAIAKAYLTHRGGSGFTAIPTSSPFTWKTAKRIESEKSITITIRPGRGKPDSEYVIPTQAPSNPQTDAEYVAHSYNHPELHPWSSMWRFPYFEVERGQDGVKVAWHAVEMPARFASIVHYKTDGTVKVIDTFRYARTHVQKTA